MHKLALNTVIAIPERKTKLFKIIGYTPTKYKITGCESHAPHDLLTGRAGKYVIPFDHFGIVVISSPTGSEVLFKHEAKHVKDLGVFVPSYIKSTFEALECELSPENLHCDGEITNAQARKKYDKIMRLWHSLEAYIGETVEPYV
jgi:hypothetical protein